MNTNSAGVASVDFLTTSSPSNNTQGFLQSLVTASAANTNTVTFYITTVQTPTTVYSPGAPAAARIDRAGGKHAAGRGARYRWFHRPASEYPMFRSVINDSNAESVCSANRSVQCAGWRGSHQLHGIASCDANVRSSDRIGDFHSPRSDITRTLAPIPFTVTAGAPAAVQITQGNNQTGSPGQRLPLALVVHVTDSGGNIVAGVPVNWQVVTAGTVTLSNVISTTDSNGNASALATARFHRRRRASEGHRGNGLRHLQSDRQYSIQPAFKRSPAISKPP